MLSNRLRHYVAWQGVSLTTFAATTGIPYRSLQDYVAGKRLPSGEQLIRLHEAGIDLNWLLTGKLTIRTFPDIGEENGDGADLLGADPVLLGRIIDHCLDLADALIARFASRDEDTASRARLRAAHCYLQAMVRVAGKVMPTAIEEGSLGVRRREVVWATLLAAVHEVDHDRIWADVTTTALRELR